MSILFGASDKDDRMRTDVAAGQSQRPTPGMAAGVGGGQWECRLRLTGEAGAEDKESDQDDTDEELAPEYTPVGWSSSVGMKEVRFISIQYSKDSLVHLEPMFTLRDFDESSFLTRLNRGLAEKVSRIHVYANEYKLLEISKSDVVLDDQLRPSRIPVDFSDAELRDPWVYIRPERSTMFMLRFSEQTPHRLFAPGELEDSLRKPFGT